MSYYVDENGKFTGIKAFDNDTSFGVIPIDKKKVSSVRPASTT